MSAQLVAPEHVCYVHCNFCNTILAVNVPGNNMINIVTVRCGHCANLLSVNLGALLQPLNPLHEFQSHVHATSQEFQKDRIGSSSKCTRKLAFFSQDQHDHTQILPIEPPEKRQRVPSAYNRFIKEEIQRIKVNNPEISHREAFSAAAKNWAHFPHIRFGLGLDRDNNKQKKLDEVVINEN